MNFFKVSYVSLVHFPFPKACSSIKTSLGWSLRRKLEALINILSFDKINNHLTALFDSSGKEVGGIGIHDRFQNRE